ncbi:MULTISPECIES: RNA-binding protein [Metallosphaera]|uniref:RNA-binding protein n=1 Tax=Metallosphaera TaxID=41980 RepID=UPI000A5C6D2F|nr:MULTISPECIES: RNA-binding protein [Metallosphaera]MCH1770952.1 RNA-binding protein [Metallosphaera sedula]MCP6729309.1 RNA-binding protein [Metallosphaera sedula]MCY0862011.1 RNA-binding protein [Metallosphaera prunae]WPX06424.1 RNA-binding protein [Metallosphaera sedula DSM 5348]
MTSRLQRHLLSQKEAKEFKEKVRNLYGVDLTSDKIEIGKEKRQLFYFVDDVLSFFGENLTPTLCFLLKHRTNLPWVKIDEGAVKAVARGADLYAPGVVEHSGDVKPGRLLVVKTKLDQPVAIMNTVEGADEALKNKRGKVASALHWIGDDMWNLCRSKS